MIASRARYEAYIASDAWQARRRLALKRDGHRCLGCGADADLHVHHRTYERFAKEPPSDLVTVCQSCHEMIHRAQVLTGRDLAVVTEEVLAELTEQRPYRRKRKRREPKRQYRGAISRDWRDEVRNGGTWAAGARQRDEREHARRVNGL